MTTVFMHDFTCPVCGEVFEDEVVASTNVTGLSTDLKPFTCGLPAYPFFVHTCPNCFFSGFGEDFEREIDVASADVIRVEMERWHRDLYPMEPEPQHRYMLAAICAEILGAAPLHVADCYLRAVWCAVDRDMHDFAHELRVEAVRFYVLAFDDRRTPARERARVAYVVGELSRRLGREEDAARWFGRVASAVVAPAEQEWLVRAARQQNENPQDRFDGGLFRP